MVMPHTVTLVMPNLVTPHGYITYGHVGYAMHGYSTRLRRLRHMVTSRMIMSVTPSTWLRRLCQTHLWHMADGTASLLRMKLYKR